MHTDSHGYIKLEPKSVKRDLFSFSKTHFHMGDISNHFGYTNLCFAGGGGKGFVYYGVLKALIQRKILSRCVNFAGSSAGAITATIAALLAFLPESRHQEIFDCVMTANFEDLIGTPRGDCIEMVRECVCDLIRLIETKGLCTGDHVESFINNLLKTSLGITENPTFQQFKDLTGKSLTITATVLGYHGIKPSTLGGKTLYFSDVNTPEASIGLAIKASIAIPGLFSPVDYEDFHLVDGGTLDNYPLNVFDRRCLETNQIIEFNTRTLGFTLHSDLGRDHSQAFTFRSYGSDLINSLCDRISTLQAEQPYYWDRTIPIPTGALTTMMFNPDESTKLWALESGYSTCLAWLDAKLEYMHAHDCGFPSIEFIQA